MLSMLPYFHDIITDMDGLKSWVPNLGIESVLSDSEGNVLGFSTYRVFLYTLLIFLFATIGWAGWYQSAKDKFYGSALLLAMSSGFYHVFLIVFELRRTVWNEPFPKLILLAILFLVLGSLLIKREGITMRKTFLWILLLIVATLPFFHDVISQRGVGLRSWVPNLGIEAMLTDSEGYVHGFLGYRQLVYFFCIHLFAHICWIGWFMDSRGKKYRPFLLIPLAQSLYQLIIILMSWWESRLNDVDIKVYITVILGILLAINFYYNNKVSPKTEVATENEQP
tara:strand:+ start:2908 stop:3750 length:843 start_codon:yes stop_codon:yes gene_type:complete